MRGRSVSGYICTEGLLDSVIRTRDRSSIPDDIVVSIISGSSCDRPCSNLLLMLFISVDSPLDQIVAEDKLLILLLQRASDQHANSLPCAVTQVQCDKHAG